MAVVCLVVTIMAVVFVVVLFGTIFRVAVQSLITIALAVAEPFKEVVRLYKNGQKRKAVLMTALLSWVFLVFPLFLFLVHLALD